MPIPVILPTLGPAIEEATLVKWLVPIGAFVRRGDPLFSVETDKTLTDIESTDEGYLIEIKAAEGSTIRVDQELAVLDEHPAQGAATPVSAPPPAPPPAAVVPPAPTAAAFAESAKTPTHDAVAVSDASAERFSETAPTGKSHASPRARRLARESGVPIDQLQGSGPGGRIIERDITAFVTQAVAGTSGATTQPAMLKRSEQFRDLPLSAVRRSIARRMMESAQGAPVFFTTVKVLTDPLTEFRSQLARARSVQVSVNDVVVRACALALRQHREINASFTGDALRIFEDIDISIAVAIDDGLITPVLRNADQKGLIAAATEIRALADKAQRGQLLVNEYQGGTFTVSNLGMFGVESFTAILNPPQAAILAVGGISREVWLDAGAPRERGVMRLTLTSDHRAIDGAQAARFLATLKALLENPFSLVV
jgi:pyruvate dehydrogenase E2 component (dihydrolipoamide acetyltransferase)